MRSSQRLLISSAIIAVTAFAAVDTLNAQGNLRGKIAVDGSSTVYPITEAVAEEFGKLNRNVRVTVGISGTGGGFKRFVIGETDLSDASRQIKAKEYKPAIENGVDFIELPVAYDGLSIVVNKQNTWAKQLTVEHLKKIFLESGMAKSWNEVDSTFPNVPIKIYAPGTDSGTFDYFKEVVAGKTGSIRPDMSVSEDDNVLVRGVTGDKGAIGFFGSAYYFENKDKLNAVAIVNGAGKAVLPTPTTIENGTYEPFSRLLFIYVSTKSAKRPEVDAFVKYYFEKGPEMAAEVGYVALPADIRAAVKNRYLNKVTGSAYYHDDLTPKEGSLKELYGVE